MSWGIIFLILFAIVVLAVVGITIYLFLIKKYNIKQVYYMIKYRGDETALMKDMMKLAKRKPLKENLISYQDPETV